MLESDLHFVLFIPFNLCFDLEASLIKWLFIMTYVSEKLLILFKLNYVDAYVAQEDWIVLVFLWRPTTFIEDFDDGI